MSPSGKNSLSFRLKSPATIATIAAALSFVGFVESFCTRSGSPIETSTATRMLPSDSRRRRCRCFAPVTEPRIIAAGNTIAVAVGITVALLALDTAAMALRMPKMGQN